MAVNEQMKLPLNGVDQYISIRGERPGAPLLLYLHGGPGDAALPLVRKYNRGLEAHFTTVVWEQRGAGKSYYKWQEGAVTMETFMQDLQALTRLLLDRFQQEKLFLVGHSWGSVLGLRFIQRCPESVRCYVGCGQVVNMEKSCREAYDFARAHGDEKAQARLRTIDCAYTGEHWLDDLLFVTGQVVRHQGSLYGKRNYNSLVWPFIASPQYSVYDLIRRQKGGMQALRSLWPELMHTNFEGQTRFDVPVVFIEGRHDHHVSSALAREYFDTIETDKQFYWFERSGHFPQWSESERFNQLMAELAAGKRFD